jgi:hypothetical protein
MHAHTMTWTRAGVPAAAALLYLAAAAAGARAQVKVIDMIGVMSSDETHQDSETHLAVDQANPQRMAVSVFLSNDPGSDLGAILFTTNGGDSWIRRNIIPSCLAGSAGCTVKVQDFDMTLSFASPGGNVYAGILLDPTVEMEILGTSDAALNTPLAILTHRSGPDQPYIRAATVLGWFDPGRERIFVGSNDSAGAPTSDSIDESLDATPTTAAFNTLRIDRGMPAADNYQVRPAIAQDGTVYAAFYRRTGVDPAGVATYLADVVVVRDDNWGQGSPPFSALSDSASMPPVAGQRVAAAVPVMDDNSTFPNVRIGGDLYLAVDPRSSSTVYVSWADRTGADPMTLHLRRSTDRGQSWSLDLLAIPSAKNAAIAVNSQGKIAYLYQQLTGTVPNRRWETHLRRSTDGSVWDDVVLSNAPAEGAGAPAPQFTPYIGDYDDMVAVGKNFYGVFSADNDPTTFPSGVVYTRNRNAAGALVGNDGMTPVAASIDPFFFRTTEISTDDDFYVRDWTDNPTTYDHGLEPSSHADFFSTSDVWNERSDDPLAPDANDRPQSNDPQPATLGPNYAFVRVSRETGGPAADVAVELFYSDGGVGVPYLFAGSTTVHFEAGQKQVTIPAGSGVQWQLASGMSNHVCLAAQIHTASDPFIPPTLFGRAPGWPSGTDLAIIGDNNKAQRNMQVFGAGGTGGPMSMFAIAHNAAGDAHDITIGVDIDPKLLESIGDGRIELVGGAGSSSSPLQAHSTVTFARVPPGEDRWIAVRGNLQGAPDDAAAGIRVYEVAGGRILNGYAFLVRRMADSDVAGQNAFQQAVVFARAAELFHEPRAAADAKAARYVADHPDAYPDFLRVQTSALEWLVADLLARNDQADPFRMHEALQALAAAGSADARAAAHLSLLNAIDAQETMLRRKGVSGPPAGGAGGGGHALYAGVALGASWPLGSTGHRYDPGFAAVVHFETSLTPSFLRAGIQLGYHFLGLRPGADGDSLKATNVALSLRGLAGSGPYHPFGLAAVGADHVGSGWHAGYQLGAGLELEVAPAISLSTAVTGHLVHGGGVLGQDLHWLDGTLGIMLLVP